MLPGRRQPALEGVIPSLSALPEPLTVGMDATLHCEWLAITLRTLGHTVAVAHAL